jgi:hypothetical protein
VSIYGIDQCTGRYVRRFKTNLKNVAQNTHYLKGLGYLVCILRILCNTEPCWTIAQVFDSIGL